jgi:hypothetical protein
MGLPITLHHGALRPLRIKRHAVPEVQKLRTFRRFRRFRRVRRFRGFRAVQAGSLGSQVHLKLVRLRWR